MFKFIKKSDMDIEVNNLKDFFRSIVSDASIILTRTMNINEDTLRKDLDSTEKKINTTLEFIQKDIGETKKFLGTTTDSLREKFKDDFVTLRQELELIKKEVDVMVKIVCHMSGAKDSGNSKEHFFDEVLRRLAKLENREDIKNE